MKRPVFVVGCPRSGTTLLYSMLMAAGGFAVYRKETYFYDLLPRFPKLTAAASRQRFLRAYLQGYLGKVPGLHVERFVRDALSQCRRSADFLPFFMNGITTAQRMERWIEATPVHVLYMQEIKRAVPDALFLHVIRDGRDCALSNERQHWLATLPWDKRRSVGVAALFWEWTVRSGRAYGRVNPADYFEVRFERLIDDRRTTLERIGRFIDHDLDYDRIEQNPVHSLKRPNTSFREERDRPDFNPVGRWKDKCSPDDVRLCEMLIGSYLEELGYALARPEEHGERRIRSAVIRAVYLNYFSTRHLLKTRTPLGRFLASTNVWSEQPKAGEQPLLPVHAQAASCPPR